MSQDYESALSESWKIYATAFEIIGEEPNEAFKWVFKRAYALGREVGKKGKLLDTYLTDEDVENVRAEYKAMVKTYESPRNSGEKEYAKGYMEALEWLFGIRFLTNQQKDNG